ncbi:MAG: hypothetical protein LBM13_05980 [Candidatus Ancillula sp.]|jgi:MFS family permease|nr:hypothetical protein [Candidatus Ancillula sp.]
MTSLKTVLHQHAAGVALLFMIFGSFIAGYDYALSKSLSDYYYQYFHIWSGSSFQPTIASVEALGSFAGAVLIAILIRHAEMKFRTLYAIFMPLYSILAVLLVFANNTYIFIILRFAASLSASALFVIALAFVALIGKGVFKRSPSIMTKRILLILGGYGLGLCLATNISRLMMIFASNEWLVDWGWRLCFQLIVFPAIVGVILFIFSSSVTNDKIAKIAYRDPYQSGRPGMNIYRKMLILSFAILILGFFSGQSVIFYSTPDIFPNIPWTSTSNDITAMIIFAVYFLSVVFIYFLVGKTSVRKVEIISISVVLSIMIILGLFDVLNNSIDFTSNQGLSYVFDLFVYVHSFANEIAFWVIPYLIVVRITPLYRLGFALSFTAGAGFLGEMLSILLPKVGENIIICIMVCILSLLLVIFMIPKKLDKEDKEIINRHLISRSNNIEKSKTGKKGGSRGTR